MVVGFVFPEAVSHFKPYRAIQTVCRLSRGAFFTIVAKAGWVRGAFNISEAEHRRINSSSR